MRQLKPCTSQPSRMRGVTGALAALTLPLLVATAHADALIQSIETDLAALGYQTGPVDGVETVETQIAISQFQADNQLEVTGTASPQLAGIIKSKTSSSATASAQAAAPVETEQECLQRKVAEAEQARKQKKGLMSLFNTVSRTASRYGGGSEIASDISEASRDIADANATKEDFEQTARDLGLSQEEIDSCKR